MMTVGTRWLTTSEMSTQILALYTCALYTASEHVAFNCAFCVTIFHVDLKTALTDSQFRSIDRMWQQQQQHLSNRMALCIISLGTIRILNYVGEIFYCQWGHFCHIVYYNMRVV